MTTQQSYRTHSRNRQGTSQPFSKFIEDLLNTNLGDAIENAFMANRAFINVLESDAAFELHVAAPGLAKTDFKLEAKDGMLHVSAERAEVQLPEGVEVRSKEFDFGKFHRTFRLDERIDAGRISAKYDQGVLIITLPKREKDAWKKEIPVD